MFDEESARYEAHLFVTFEHVDLCGELGGLPVVVRVEEGDEIPARLVDPEVARTRSAAVRLPEKPNLVAVAREDGTDVVGATVVDDEELIRWPRLTEYAVDRTLDRTGRTVCRD